jgi:hypothetical protein
MNDSTAAADAERGRRLAESWKDWLKGFRWEFWATGTWERPVTPSTAMRTVNAWLSVRHEAYAAIGLQRGPRAMTHHVHLMVGGVNVLAGTLLRRSWVKHGHVRVERYDPRRDAIGYMVDQADEIVLVGTPQRFQPRRTRR